MGNYEMCEREMTVEEMCQSARKEIEYIKQRIVGISENHQLKDMEDVKLEGANMPQTMTANIKANLTLAFRHLEDAMMRLGKAMQAYQGGISILDKHSVDSEDRVK